MEPLEQRRWSWSGTPISVLGRATLHEEPHGHERDDDKRHDVHKARVEERHDAGVVGAARRV